MTLNLNYLKQFRFLLTVAYIIILGNFDEFSTYAAQVNLKEQIENLTNSRVKFVWARGIGKQSELDIESENYALWMYDSYENNIRELLPGPKSYSNPCIIPDGSGVMYTDCPHNSIYISDWTGKNVQFLKKGYGLSFWQDPTNKEIWLFFSDTAYGSVIKKINLANPSSEFIVYDKSSVSIRFRISGDGKKAAGEFPWPKASLLDLKTSVLTDIGVGCNTAISPDTNYRIFHMIASHREIYMYDRDGTNRRTIKLSNAPGVNEQTVWAPRWTNDAQFFTLEGPCSSDSARPEILLGKFDSSFNSVASWIQITRDTFLDAYPNGWLSKSPQLQLSSYQITKDMMDSSWGLPFKIDAHSSNNSLTILQVSSSKSWCKIISNSQSNSTWTYTFQIDSTGVQSGLNWALITFKAPNLSTEKCLITFVYRKNSQPVKVALSPNTTTMTTNSSTIFTPSIFDQAGDPVFANLIWSSSAGTITESGVFWAPEEPGICSVFVSIAGSTLQANAHISVTKDPSVNNIFTIVSPKFEDFINIGDSLRFRWDTKVNIAGVLISLSIDEGRNWNLLTSEDALVSTDPKFGNWSWFVPETLITEQGIPIYVGSNKCQLKIQNYFNKEQVSTSQTFTIGRKSTSSILQKKINLSGGSSNSKNYYLLNGKILSGIDVIMPTAKGKILIEDNKFVKTKRKIKYQVR